jgi:8-amino-7-oxononanoate synthase
MGAAEAGSHIDVGSHMDVGSAFRRTDTFESRVRRRLDALDAQGLRRSLSPPSGIDLSSNDYLSLSAHPSVVAGFMAAAAREGCGSTGSRLLRGEREAFSDLERRFAAFKGADRALYFSSGYLANLAVLATFAEPGDIIFSDAANHASLIDGTRLSRAQVVVFGHNDVLQLESLLSACGPREGSESSSAAARASGGGAPRAVMNACGPGEGQRFVVVESLFSMDGDEAPLREYAALCRDTGSVLVVDEAHAVGVFGSRGSGLLEASGLDANQCLSISTAGKALGVAGAFVAGPEWAIQYLIQRGRPFVFSTAPPPAVADAIDASLTLVEKEPERRARVLALAAHLRRRLAEAGAGVLPGRSQIVPVMIGDNDRAVAVAAQLQREGFDVRAIRPPSVPQGTARLRVSVNASLSEAVLDRFTGVLASALREAGLCSAVSS